MYVQAMENQHKAACMSKLWKTSTQQHVCPSYGKPAHSNMYVQAMQNQHTAACMSSYQSSFLILLLLSCSILLLSSFQWGRRSTAPWRTSVIQQYTPSYCSYCCCLLVISSCWPMLFPLGERGDRRPHGEPPVHRSMICLSYRSSSLSLLLLPWNIQLLFYAWSSQWRTRSMAPWRTSSVQQ